MKTISLTMLRVIDLSRTTHCQGYQSSKKKSALRILFFITCREYITIQPLNNLIVSQKSWKGRSVHIALKNMNVNSLNTKQSKFTKSIKRQCIWNLFLWSLSKKAKSASWKIILLTSIFGLPRKTVMSWKQNIPQCVIRKKKMFINLPAFLSVLRV